MDVGFVNDNFIVRMDEIQQINPGLYRKVQYGK